MSCHDSRTNWSAYNRYLTEEVRGGGCEGAAKREATDPRNEGKGKKSESKLLQVINGCYWR